MTQSLRSIEVATEIANLFDPGFFDDRMLSDVASIIDRALAAPADERDACEGVGVFLFGGAFEPVAWFKYADQAERWGQDNYFGRWLTWRSIPPRFVPLTPEEEAECKRKAEEWAAKVRVKEGAIETSSQSGDTPP